MKLTKTIVAGATPRAQRYRLNDSLVPGLCLLVLPSGARTFYLRHRVDGRQRELRLGTPVELTPDQARALAREALAKVRPVMRRFSVRTSEWPPTPVVKDSLTTAPALPLPAGDFDGRDLECVKCWPDCYNGGYDPRCCRFPKSCSCGHLILPLPAGEGET
jgi:hypothetical protein